MMLHYKNQLKEKNNGAILIEFAFAIPILITVLYFTIDAPLLQITQSKMKNSAHFFVNMIQNISQYRPDEKITQKDLDFSCCSTFLNVYRSISQYNLGENRYPAMHFGHASLYYIKGLPGNKASVIWRWDSNAPNNSPNFRKSSVSTIVGSNNPNSVVKFLKNTAPSSIHKTLKIEEGETKMIADISFHSPDSLQTKDGASVKNISPNKRFGFYIIPLRASSGDAFFNYVITFSPRPGLFSDTPP